MAPVTPVARARTVLMHLRPNPEAVGLVDVDGQTQACPTSWQRFYLSMKKSK